MTAPPRSVNRIWKAASLRVVFHKFSNGKLRPKPLAWAPKDSTADLLSDAPDQNVIVTVSGADNSGAAGVRIDLNASYIGLSRDEPAAGWNVICVEDDQITVQVNEAKILIRADGSVIKTDQGQTTYLDGDGTVIKRGEDIEAIMSGDGLSLSRRTPDMIAAITPDGVVARAVCEE